MSAPYISHIELDEATILRRNADIEQERKVAMFDLIEDNMFRPLRVWEAGYGGPYGLRLSVADGRLLMEVSQDSDPPAQRGWPTPAGPGAAPVAGRFFPLETIALGLGRLRRPIREYFAICDSYFQAIRRATAQEIETIDMARRSSHNNAAQILQERLEGKVEVDFPTARRLFTLICVLHIRGADF